MTAERTATPTEADLEMIKNVILRRITGERRNSDYFLSGCDAEQFLWDGATGADRSEALREMAIEMMHSTARECLGRDLADTLTWHVPLREVLETLATEVEAVLADVYPAPDSSTTQAN